LWSVFNLWKSVSNISTSHSNLQISNFSLPYSQKLGRTELRAAAELSLCLAQSSATAHRYPLPSPRDRTRSTQRPRRAVTRRSRSLGHVLKLCTFVSEGRAEAWGRIAPVPCICSRTPSSPLPVLLKGGGEEEQEEESRRGRRGRGIAAGRRDFAGRCGCDDAVAEGRVL
jgi:hypothetical protein